MVRKEKRIVMNNEWDCIVDRYGIDPTENFIQRVYAEAKRQKARPDFFRHYHPTEVDTLKSLQDGIAPSQGDLDSFAEELIDWYDIRSLGTDEEPDSRTVFTGQIYHMAEIDALAEPVRAIIRQIAALDAKAEPGEVYAAAQQLRPYFEKLSQLNHSFSYSILPFICGDAARLRFRDQRDVFSLPEMVLQIMFNRASDLKSSSLERLSRITTVALERHASLKTHSLYREIFSRGHGFLGFGLRLDALGQEKKALITGLSVATDPVKIKEGHRLLQEFAGTLPAEFFRVKPERHTGFASPSGKLTRIGETVVMTSDKGRVFFLPRATDSTADNQRNPGGIDLNAQLLDLQSRGKGIDFNLPADFDPARLENLRLDGLAPFIYSITPLPSLMPLLGKDMEEGTPQKLSSLP